MPYTALRHLPTGDLFPYHEEMAKRGDMQTVTLALPGEGQTQPLPESVAGAVDNGGSEAPVVPAPPVLVPQLQVVEPVDQSEFLAALAAATQASTATPAAPPVVPPLAPPLPEHLGLAASLESALTV